MGRDILCWLHPPLQKVLFIEKREFWWKLVFRGNFFLTVCLTHWSPTVSRGFPKFGQIGKMVISHPMTHVQWKYTTYRAKKPTPLWSKIVKITNYGIKYTSCQLKVLQKTNLKFVLASHGRNLIRLEGMCLFTQDYAVVTFCQWKQKENRQNAFLNEKFIQKSLCLCLRKKIWVLLSGVEPETLPLCSSRNNPYPPHGRSLEIPRGRGVLIVKILEAMYEAKLEFPGGDGGCKTKKPSMGGVNGYFLELHIWCDFELHWSMASCWPLLAFDWSVTILFH